MSQKELQEKMLRYQMLEEKFKQMNQQREMFAMRMMEIEQTKQAIEELEKSGESEVLVPLGSSVFLPGKINKKEKVVVGIGTDTLVEKSSDEVKKILEDRKKTLETGLENIQNNMLKVAQEIQSIQEEQGWKISRIICLK